MAKGYNAVKKGLDPRKDSVSGTAWLSLEGGQTIDVVCLVEVDDILACEQCAIWLKDHEKDGSRSSPVWVYTGPEDPSHDMKIDKRYRAYLPVLVDGEPKVWSMGKQAHTQILDIADGVGSIRGQVLRLKRTGTGMATRYSVINRGQKRDVSNVEEVDVLSMLGPLNADEVKEMIAEKLGVSSYQDVLDKYRGKAKAEPAPAKGRKNAVIEDDDEEDLDDLTLN